jgi:hypothetical protein
MLDPQTRKLSLPDVTLVTAYNIAHELSAMAIEECLKKIEPADVIVFSDKPPKIPGVSYRPVQGPEELNWWENIVWYEIPEAVKTSHFLLVQYDSWVLEQTCWSNEWLEHDYIGAPWWRFDERYNMGNGGFSLRSTKLMRHLARNRDTYPLSTPEDNAICLFYRPSLELEFKYAPVEDALTFSRERVEVNDSNGKRLPTFGYHGVFRWPEFLTVEEIKKRLRLAPDYVISHVNTQQLLQALETDNVEMERDSRDAY